MGLLIDCVERLCAHKQKSYPIQSQWQRVDKFVRVHREFLYLFGTRYGRARRIVQQKCEKQQIASFFSRPCVVQSFILTILHIVLFIVMLSQFTKRFMSERIESNACNVLRTERTQKTNVIDTIQ